MRRRVGRPTYREILIRNKAALDFMAAAAGKPCLDITIPPPPKKRAPRTASGKPLERDVLKAIVQALRLDPRVSRVERNQVGVFQEGNRYIRVGSKGKLDLTVYLKSGRYAEIEVKRPGEKPKPHQQDRIDSIRAAGGIAGYATSIEEAQAILP